MSALGNLFSDIAGAIREKTGETGTMKPAQFPEKIRGIEGGGSADVRYVTFMSHDGTVEYGKKAVAVGDDCANPIDRKVFNTPTRESTAQYDFTFIGWSKTVNGALDDTALDSVEEDRTVYSVYASVVRYHTITYYDGDTVLKTESLPYGSEITYTPEKDGYQFEEWTPAVKPVTGSASYYAQWTSVLTFANATWEQIAEISASGDAPNRFAVGDEKTLGLNFSGTTEAVKIRIIGFNHDDLADGTGKAGISIAVAQGIKNTAVEVAETSTYDNGIIWRNSKIRTALNSGAIYQALPADLRAVLKTVTKTSNAGFNEHWGGLPKNSLYTTNDKVWLLSSTEVGLDNAISASYVALGQGTQYEYYTSDASRIIDRPTGSSLNSYRVYATRSMDSQYTGCSVVAVSHEGKAISRTLGKPDSSSSVFGRAFGFCV